MRFILPIILMVWPYVPFAICFVPGFEFEEKFLYTYVILTVVVYIANVVNAFKFEDAKVSALFNMLMKIVHIPFYLLVFFVGIMMIGASVVPVLIFVTPVFIMGFVIIDFLLMLTTSMYGVNAIRQARKAGKVSFKFALVNTLLHFFFVADIISSVVVFGKVRKDTE